LLIPDFRDELSPANLWAFDFIGIERLSKRYELALTDFRWHEKVVPENP
jgi:hypothetical protein